MMLKRSLIAALAGLAMLSVHAEQAETFSGYAVHYNAFSTDMLDPGVASAYHIQRSKNRALLNISVLKKVMGTSGTPVAAQVSASATNLAQQFREIPLHQVKDGEAIYYLGEFRINNEETLKFTIHVTPAEGDPDHEFSFTQQFFTD